MERYLPPTLRSALARGRLRPGEAVRLAVLLCDALIEAHRRGVPHGDVRPENVLLLPGNTGLQLIPGGRPVTTPRAAYVAPECRRGWSPPHVRADLFAVGVVLYEMLVGRPPVGRFAWPGQVDPAAGWLDPIVVRCLSDDPAHRYASAAELRADLLGTPRVAWAGRWPTVAILACGLVIGVILAVVLVRMATPGTAKPAIAATAVPSTAPVVVANPAPLVSPPPVLTPPPATVPPAAAILPPPPAAISPPSAAALTTVPEVDPSIVDNLNRQLAEQRAAAAQARAQLRQALAARRSFGNGPEADAASGTQSVQAGARGGGPFRKVRAGNAPVLGVSYSLGTWGGAGCLRQVDPIYDAADVPPPAGGRRQIRSILARPGYAVGGLTVDYDDTNVLAFGVIFFRWRDGRLDPADRYTSPLVDFPDDGQQPQQLGGDGRTVVGLCGRQGLNLAAIGVVTVAAAPP